MPGFGYTSDLQLNKHGSYVATCIGYSYITNTGVIAISDITRDRG